jgi:hypothetical protein
VGAPPAAGRESKLKPKGENMDKNLFEKIGTRIDVSDLPDELKSQLMKNFKSSNPATLDYKILAVLDSFEGFANLDEILVGLYRQFSFLQTRGFICNKIYKMCKQGSVQAISGRKGAYKKV